MSIHLALSALWNLDPRSIAHNCTLVAKLKTNAAFLYKVFDLYSEYSPLLMAFETYDPDAMSGYMQGSVISEVLHMVWFDGKTSQGVVFEKLFNPIPFETLALIMTVVSDFYTMLS